jgi:ADP-heptose:LPS heptosyltransferase
MAATGVGAAPVVLHPGSGWPLKNWPVARWAALAATLRDRRGITAVVLGSPGEAGIVAAVVDAAAGAAVAGTQVSLAGLAALHARARLVITTDNGAAHLAATMGAPLVALFGPGDPIGYRPSCPSTRLRVVRVGLECSPCGTLEHPPCGAVTDPACVTGISIAMVLAAVDDLLDAQSRAADYAAG